MITPNQVIESFQNLPQNTSVEEMIERIIVLEQIETAREQSRNGQVHSNDEVKAMVKEWKKK
ncbi:MAG: hypothetical protein U5N85_05325 [Arcicella sp.]|nr:hypothetical protein [Arcicella sp.]